LITQTYLSSWNLTVLTLSNAGQSKSSETSHSVHSSTAKLYTPATAITHRTFNTEITHQ